MAAGRGERLGGGLPKALRPLGGEPLIVRAVRAMRASPVVDVTVVAAPPGFCDDVLALLGPAALVVAGGETRRESVSRALSALPASCEVVLVHDAARPLAPPGLATAVAEAVLGGAPAVVPGLPVADTVKRVDAAGTVLETLDRTGLRAVQTPQGFRRDVLVAAHAAADADAGSDPAATDDAVLVERLGVPVRVVPGDPRAMKVTTAADLLAAATLVPDSA